MDRTERFYKIEHLLHERRTVSFSELCEELGGVSPATLKRDLVYMRDRFNAPIIWDRANRGYCFDQSPRQGPKYELPGLWFSSPEVYALLTMEHLLKDLQPGILSPHIKPLQVRLNAILGSLDNSPKEIEKRIRILRMGRKEVKSKYFELVATALLKRRCLHIRHFNRTANQHTERDISPQRLVHYRDNWYVDAWCHLRNDLRSFALDAVETVTLKPQKARDIPDTVLDAYVQSGYGIFAGKEVNWAKLRFSPSSARWVVNEEWHPKQKSYFDNAGFYILEIPYSRDPELIMDILRHGSDIEVLQPAELRSCVQKSLTDALQLYPPVTPNSSR